MLSSTVAKTKQTGVIDPFDINWLSKNFGFDPGDVMAHWGSLANFTYNIKFNGLETAKQFYEIMNQAKCSPKICELTHTVALDRYKVREILAAAGQSYTLRPAKPTSTSFLLKALLKIKEKDEEIKKELTMNPSQLPTPSSLNSAVKEETPELASGASEFLKVIKGKNLIYTARTATNSIQEVRFNQDWLFNLLTFHGDFDDCSDLKKYNEGPFGDVRILEMTISVHIKNITSKKLHDLFNCIEHYEPLFKAIKQELLNILLPLTNPALVWLRGSEKDPDTKKDLKDMYSRLIDYPEEFNNITAETTIMETCRTVNAHYRHTNYRIHDRENIQRTTILAPGFDLWYIEYATTPEIDFGEDSNGTHYARQAATHQWVIAFNDTQCAKKYLEATPKPSSCNLSLFATAHPRYSNLFCIESEHIDGVLNKLVEAGACPKEATEPHLSSSTRAVRLVY